LQEMLLECCGDGGLSRCGQTSEPDCAALLLAEGVALVASETRVPGDVAGGVSACLVEGFQWLELELVMEESKNLRRHCGGMCLRCAKRITILIDCAMAGIPENNNQMGYFGIEDYGGACGSADAPPAVR